MISWLIRRRIRAARKEAMQQLVVELFELNNQDCCWDPIGSVDYGGMKRAIEVIAQDRLDVDSVKEARLLFRGRR